MSEVRSLLQLLGLSDVADITYSLEVMSDTRKRNAAVPEHLPVKSTLFNVLHTCCEIREVPRKVCYSYSLVLQIIVHDKLELFPVTFFSC